MAIQGVTPSFRRLVTCSFLAVFVASCSSETGQSRSAIRPGSSDSGQCVDYSGDSAGCQPSTFDTPIGQMPSVRVDAQGGLDPFSSEADARAGFAALETEVGEPAITKKPGLMCWLCLTAPKAPAGAPGSPSSCDRAPDP